ncbi:MAG TPA: hypothetical protein VHO24_05265 [Opitutaceae bacterium]|nr:hypothetical protein [Opitutaceae bacterium]
MKNTETRYWLWAVVMPAIVFAIVYFGLRFALKGETDGVSGKTFVIAFLASVPAMIASSVLTLASVKSAESLSKVAVASCVIYFGACVTVLFF